MNNCSACKHEYVRVNQLPCSQCINNSSFDRKPFTDEELGTVFGNEFDCYANITDDSSVMAMTKERFIETVKELLTKD